MKIIINLDHELSPDLQVLFFLYKNHPDKVEGFEARYSPDSIPNNKPYKETLINRGYITSSGKINSLKTAVSSLEELCDLVLPKIVTIYKKTNRTGIAGDLVSVKRKLLAFFKDYPQYADQELLLNATQRYINSGIKDQYKYIQELTYFVHKQGVGSKLAVYCEEVAKLEFKPSTFADYGSDI